jgi:site-specific recombinase XerD
MELFDQFIQERVYLKGVAPKTVVSYRCAFNAFAGATETKPALMQRMMELRERDISPIGINCYLRHIKAYLRWMEQEGHFPEPFKLQFLKTESKVLATFTPEHVKLLVAFKPKGINQIRTHTAVLLMLDGGYRISEVLGLPFENCDFDSLVVKVRGKGGKHRLVPMSTDMRKVLFKYANKYSAPGRLLFGTRNNTLVTVRNFDRDFTLIGRKLGITGVRVSPHTLRHTFAVSYLRAGGNLFYLSRVLGHSSVTTTQKYLQSVNVDDLQAVHDRLSPLAMDHGGRQGVAVR